MPKISHKKYLELQKKYYLGKILCTIDPEHPDAFLHHQFNRVFIIFGFTGSGKDTIINEFLKKNLLKPKKTRYSFVKFIRTLTRQRRPVELDIADGFFIEKELFDHLKKNGRFFYSYKRYSGKEFGYDTIHFIFELIRKNIIMVGGGEKNFEGLITGIKSLFDSIPITTIFINRPKAEIIKSLKKRGGNQEGMKKRIEHIENAWYKNPKKPMDYCIWNRDLKKAVEQLIKIVNDELQIL
ncbi:hypothetical protein HYV57_02505 [Candidatus Peregrinibacteria bacterium]|nr:hypothetical protein [Candidatus Peregrinibacteria bacterium]